MKNIHILTLLLIFLAACTSNQDLPGNDANSRTTQRAAINQESPCGLPPITIPTLPPEIPGYAQLDETTGLHVTGKPIEIDFAAYRLSVTGLVENPISFTYEELRCLPKVTDDPLLSCRGYFEDLANWSGVLLYDLLQQAKPLAEAKTVTMISADGYSADISLSVAMDQRSFLAYEWEEQPLPILHGFPLRAVIPTREGLYWVKWLVEIKIH
jgi:DMSO/TMAO reductase YedYZ molybdopterin-dependent catalytic subunit